MELGVRIFARYDVMRSTPAALHAMVDGRLPHARRL
jgi:hypothetical protein